MKKITPFLKLPFYVLLKTVVAMMLGLGSSMGKNVFEDGHRDNKTIGSEK